MHKLWREASKQRKRGVNKPGKRNVLSAKSEERDRKEKKRAEQVEREREERKKMECKEKERREKQRREQERQEKQERRDRQRKDRHHRRREEDRADRSVNWFSSFIFGGLSEVPARRERRGPHPKFIVERFCGVLWFCSHNG